MRYNQTALQPPLQSLPPADPLHLASASRRAEPFRPKRSARRQHRGAGSTTGRKGGTSATGRERGADLDRQHHGPAAPRGRQRFPSDRPGAWGNRPGVDRQRSTSAAPRAGNASRVTGPAAPRAGRAARRQPILTGGTSATGRERGADLDRQHHGPAARQPVKIGCGLSVCNLLDSNIRNVNGA